MGFWSNTVLPTASLCGIEYEASEEADPLVRFTSEVIEIHIEDEKTASVIWGRNYSDSIYDGPDLSWVYTKNAVQEGVVQSFDEQGNGDLNFTMSFPSDDGDIELEAALAAAGTSGESCDYFELEPGKAGAFTEGDNYTGGDLYAIGDFHILNVEMIPDIEAVESFMQKVR